MRRVPLIAPVARKQLLEDMYFQLLPGRAVASISLLTLIDVVVGFPSAIVNSYREWSEILAHALLKPISRNSRELEAQNAGKRDVDHWLNRDLAPARPLLAGVAKLVIECLW